MMIGGGVPLTSDTLLPILYEDDNLVVINKPHGLLVHQSKIARDAKLFALQMLRNQIGQRVYPVHRLDRKTSGAMIFAKSKVVNADLQQAFRERKVQKTYVALVRGFTDAQGTIDYAIGETKKQEAVTDYKTVAKYEIPYDSNGFSTSRYSLVEVDPKTGRMHQIRKHFAHIFHPIIGDRPHGCNKQNRFWKEKFDMNNMLLHASELAFQYHGEPYHITAPLSQVFSKTIDLLESLQV